MFYLQLGNIINTEMGVAISHYDDPGMKEAWDHVQQNVRIRFCVTL